MKTPAKMRAVVVGACVLALGGACDLGKTSNQLSAKSVAVATILVTPPVFIPPAAVAANGFDASIPAGFDGGGFDAGVFMFDGGITLPGQTVASLFFGQRQGESLDSAPVGVTGAKATLKEVGGNSWPLIETGLGSYSLLGEDAGYRYKELATYDFVVEDKGTTYTAEVTQVPAQERITAFHPAAGFVDHPAATEFKFTRPEPASGESRNVGFVTVFPVKADGTEAEPSFTNVPTTPLEFLKLLAAPQEWKTTQVIIPATAFPDVNRNYIVLFQNAKSGGPKSENLFSGSAILAASADVAIIKTR